MLSWTPAFFPQYYWAHVSATLVQQQLRESFTQWGLPWAMRVDNGTPWGARGDLPTPLAMWLIGLGIEMAWNPPRQPKKMALSNDRKGQPNAGRSRTCAPVLWNCKSGCVRTTVGNESAIP